MTYPGCSIYPPFPSLLASTGYILTNNRWEELGEKTRLLRSVNISNGFVSTGYNNLKVILCTVLFAFVHKCLHVFVGDGFSEREVQRDRNAFVCMFKTV